MEWCATVPIAQGHAPLRLLRPCQPKSYITILVTIRVLYT